MPWERVLYGRVLDTDIQKVYSTPRECDIQRLWDVEPWFL